MYRSIHATEIIMHLYIIYLYLYSYLFTIENALKYAGKGKTVWVKTWDEPEWVYIEVRDNGLGIGSNDLAHIFDKFYRVKNDSTHAIKGSGLGLYLVKYFIELHNGVISASSQLGEGTSFIIKLKNE